MKLALSAAVALAGIGLAAGSASAQYPAFVPHRGHYHVVPSYQPPVVQYAYPSYSEGYSFRGGNNSPGFGFGGSYSNYGNRYYSPSPDFGNFSGAGFGYGGGHHQRYHHHHHGHR